MNKKGFTLVELLAVIVILAIIALIATPIVINVVNESREKANLRSIESYAKAYETAYYQALLTDSTVQFTDSSKVVPQYSGTRITDCVMTLGENNKVVAKGCKIAGSTKTYEYDSETGASVQTTTSSDAGQGTGK